MIQTDFCSNIHIPFVNNPRRRYRNEMALVNDYRPDRAKYNASAVSIVIDGNPHIFYVVDSRMSNKSSVVQCVG